MAQLRAMLRAGVIGAGAVLLSAGALALGLAYAPEHAAVESLQRGLGEGVEQLVALSGARLSSALPAAIELWLAHPLARFGLAPLGLILLVGAWLPGRSGAAPEAAGGREERVPVDGRALRRAHKAAAAMARRGLPLEAAEIAFSHGQLEDAACYYIDAGEFERAAEVRHDQNRFVESAELYLKAGRFDAAGNIFGQQQEFARAADAYLEAGNQSLAAEMFLKGGDFARAASCFAEAGLPRHAAQAWVKCEQWEKAAACLEEVIRDEGGRGVDARKQAELKKLCRMAGNLYERAGRDERAQEVFTRGACHAAAGEAALRRGRDAEAAALFLEAREALRAAEILNRLGDAKGSARVLAEHYRDSGDDERAARYFEEAGDALAAADLYRLLERHAEAGACYERQGEHAQAAEMFRLAGDRARAAACFERAGLFAEAAECHALDGNSEHEAQMLTRAGEYLRAGEIHRRAGRVDEAIKVLQKVPTDGADAPAASALLGAIFRERGMLSLAVKKLSHAVGDQELSRANIGAFYELATVHESNGDLQQASELYEKILAFDYHYADAQARLEQLREQLKQRQDSRSPAAEPENPLSEPRSEGRYRIVGKLGRGGMGIVYKANDSVLDRVVAFKVLPDSLKENPQALKNFLREAKSAAQLNHPNIVTVYDAGEQGGVYYIAMEYVDGHTLKEIVKQRGRISSAGIVHVMVQMCEALAYAHEKKIVHRDIKTANTMWTRDRKAKIMDFGLAKVVEEVRNHTTVVSGTPYYMSPEQTLGRNVDQRSDLYSLGVTLFELATGTLPFRDGNLPYHHVHTPPPDPRDLHPELPVLIAGIIAKCLQKDPAHRYQSAQEILGEVRASFGG